MPHSSTGQAPGGPPSSPQAEKLLRARPGGEPRPIALLLTIVDSFIDKVLYVLLADVFI